MESSPVSSRANEPAGKTNLDTALRGGPFETLALASGVRSVEDLCVLTDRPPRKSSTLKEFQESDRLAVLALPPDGRFLELAHRIESAMGAGSPAGIRIASAEFLAAAADFYKVRRPEVRALAARPLRVRESSTTELFGDYTPDTVVIRVWTRTAVRKQVTSFGTFLSTLCHEFCHHLDCDRFGFHRTPHTRGFYERTAILYHHARGTPRKRLVWVRMPRGLWRIDWQRTRAEVNSQQSETVTIQPGSDRSREEKLCSS